MRRLDMWWHMHYFYHKNMKQISLRNTQVALVLVVVLVLLGSTSACAP